MNIDSPISQITRIGPSVSEKLHRMGIKQVKDLLFHFPTRYEDFSEIIPISAIAPNIQVTVVGTVGKIKVIRTPRRRMMIVEAIVKDDSGSIKAVWFNQPYLSKIIKEGDTIVLSGKTTLEKNSIIFQHPGYQIIKTFDREQFLHAGRLIPIYPETSGLSSRWFRYFIKTLSPLFDKIADPLPPDILTRQNLFPLSKALRQIHFPDSLGEASQAKRRFAFEDLLVLTLAAQRMRRSLREKNAPQIPFQEEITKKFVTSLPFKLTDGQRKAAWEILLDLAKSSPMNRLLEGDVGSGKTVVAAIAALNCVSQRYQVILMAPTGILAHQHFKTISKILPQKYTLAIVTGSACQLYSKKLRQFMPLSRQKLQKRLANGTIDIVIGTHSLISKKAEKTLVFKNLALAIVDEQHRFGVEQRARLTQKKSGIIPHFLSMTATPIPRTLALTVFGDLDISVLEELPSGRKKIETKIVTSGERSKVYQFIEEEIQRGRQTFVVCPLIEESEKLQVAAATKEFEKLKTHIFPHLSIGLLHGKMKSKEKEKVLQEFKEKKSQILVTTPVVEVGIDVPNASIMMIEGPERFGLAQLHQFRGRVGRAEHQSYCFLLAETPTARLQALVRSSSGFELAQKDLEFRGPGDFYGTRQSGIPDLAMSHMGDVQLVRIVRNEALSLLKENHTLTPYPLLKKKVKEVEENLHLE